jgi:hypothetical protein
VKRWDCNNLSATIRLVKIEISPCTKAAAEDGSATVFLEITTEGQPVILLSFMVRDFRSLDQAAEEARKQVLAFAQELAVAAGNPLIPGTEEPMAASFLGNAFGASAT